MKKAIKNYLTKLQENEKKGFSLVELIIVMAIMAILVGIVASQVLPYMEKSRQSKDQQIISSACTDFVSAVAQAPSAITNNIGLNISQGGSVTVGQTCGDATLDDKITALFTELHGTNAFKFKSKKAGTNGISMTYDASTGKVTGTPTGVTDEDKLKVETD